MPKHTPKPYERCTSSREVWDLSLQRRIDQLDTRFHRHDHVDQTERLNKILPNILRRKQRYEARKYAYLSDEEQAIVDGMKPYGKVWAWARSNKEFS